MTSRHSCHIQGAEDAAARVCSPAELHGSALRRSAAVVGVISAIVTWGWSATSAGFAAPAHIYWTNGSNGTIGEANLNGTEVNQAFITGASVPEGIVVHARSIYWANFSSAAIGRANLEGKEVNQAFIKAASEPTGVAADAQHLYWENYGKSAKTIGRANLEGKEVNQEFIGGANEPLRVAVDAGHIYWINRGTATIGRANLEGKEVNQEFIKGLGPLLEGIAVYSGHIYWTNYGIGTIGRANLEGKEVNQEFIKGGSNPLGLTVDSGHIYWANQGAGTIGRANLEGEEVNQEFIKGAEGPSDVAIAAGAPSASISSPASGGVYTLGATVPTTFSCSEGEGGPGLESCDDGNGSATATGGTGHLNTSTVGVHTYAVTAMSKDGQADTASITYTVTVPKTATITMPPVSPPVRPPVEKGRPHVSTKTGEITVEYEFPEPGEAEEEAQVGNGASLARFGGSQLLDRGAGLAAFHARSSKKHAKCKKGYVRKGRRCVSNAAVRYGRVTLNVATAGRYKLDVEPTGRVLSALKKGKTLTVRLILVFTPASTTDHITETISAKVHLKLKKKHR